MIILVLDSIIPWHGMMAQDAATEKKLDFVAAANEKSHAEARLAKPSQASQSREGLTNGFGYLCDGKVRAMGPTTGFCLLYTSPSPRDRG